MRISIQNGQVVLGDVGAYYATLRGWGLLTWHKPTQTMRGPVGLDLLDNLARLGKLAPEVEFERQRLKAIKDAVDAERNNEAPVPLMRYPVKAKLFAHQIRGCNMCLLAFGAVDPKGVAKHEGIQ